MSRIIYTLCACIVGLIIATSLDAVPLPVKTTPKTTPQKKQDPKPAPKPTPKQQMPSESSDDELARTTFSSPLERKLAAKMYVSKQLAKDVPVLLDEKGEFTKQPSK